MASQWRTSFIPLEGGLILNEPHLKLSQELPGAAILLENMTPDIKTRGYSKIKGFTKFSDSVVPDGGNSDSKIKGVYALENKTVITNRNKKLYYSIGGAWTEINSTAFVADSGKMRGVSYNFSGFKTTVFVDGVNKPYTVRHQDFAYTLLSAAPSEISAPTSVEVFFNRLFFAQGNKIVFTAANTDNDFAVANGAGVINVGEEVVGLKSFRDTLFIFLKTGIKSIVGKTTSTFNVIDIAKSNGCFNQDTIQEIDGDIVYLSTNGIRFLSDTQKSGLFSAESASYTITKKLIPSLSGYTTFSSCLIPSKNEYRIFFFDEGLQRKASIGYAGVQFGSQGEQRIQWASLRGIKAFSCSTARDSFFEDFIVFNDETEYVYRMESGLSFDGEPIDWAYWSPYLYFDDPIVRKTIHNTYFYGVVSSEIEGTVSVKIDFDDFRILQPKTEISNVGSDTFSDSVYGLATYGVSTYGVTPIQRFYVTSVGSGETFSFRVYGSGGEEDFNLNTIVVEYRLDGRQ